LGLHDLGNLGSADVAEKKMTVSLNGLSWEQFAKLFSTQIGELQKGTVATLQQAINSGKEVKLKKDAGDLDKFFSKVEVTLAAGLTSPDDHRMTAAKWNDVGLDWLEKKDYAHAVAAFEKMVKLDPKNASGWSNLGLARLSQEDFAGAAKACEKATILDPGNATAWAYLASVRVNKGDLPGATAACEKAADIDPGNVTAWDNLGTVRLSQNDIAGAVAAYEKMAALVPENATTIWNNLGTTRLNQGDFAGAAAAFKKLVELDPENAAALNNLGTARLNQKDLAGAAPIFEKLVELDPGNATVWAFLASIRFSQNDFAAAVPAFQKQAELDPANAEAWFGIGFSWLKLQNYTEAVPAMQNALSLSQEQNRADITGGAYFYLAQLSAVMGNLPDSLEFLQQAIGVNPQWAMKAKAESDFEPLRGDPVFDNLMLTPEERAAAEEQSRKEERDLAAVEKLKKLVQVSKKLKVSQMATILKLDEKDLYDHIVDWTAEFGFTLDEDVVEFGAGRKDDFIASLDQAFVDWNKKSEAQDNKV